MEIIQCVVHPQYKYNRSISRRCFYIAGEALKRLASCSFKPRNNAAMKKRRDYWKWYSCLGHELNIHLWIICFPAFMNGKCTFTLVSTGWILAFLEKAISNMADFIIQFVNMCLNLFKMNFTIVIDNSANKILRIYSTNVSQTKQFSFLTWIHGKGSSCSISMRHLHELDHH